MRFTNGYVQSMEMRSLKLHNNDQMHDHDFLLITYEVVWMDKK